MSVFTTSPYSLQYGDIVKARVSATNPGGTSTVSSTNSAGATVYTSPTVGPTPTSGAGTSDSSIELNWSSITTPPDNGGSAVNDYGIYWD